MPLARTGTSTFATSVCRCRRGVPARGEAHTSFRRSRTRIRHRIRASAPANSSGRAESGYAGRARRTRSVERGDSNRPGHAPGPMVRPGTRAVACPAARMRRSTCGARPLRQSAPFRAACATRACTALDAFLALSDETLASEQRRLALAAVPHHEEHDQERRGDGHGCEEDRHGSRLAVRTALRIRRRPPGPISDPNVAKRADIATPVRARERAANPVPEPVCAKYGQSEPTLEMG